MRFLQTGRHAAKPHRNDSPCTGLRRVAVYSGEVSIFPSLYLFLIKVSHSKIMHVH